MKSWLIAIIMPCLIPVYARIFITIAIVMFVVAGYLQVQEQNASGYNRRQGPIKNSFKK